MRDVLEIIDATINAKGLSRASVSERATGNATTLKNLHATKSQDRDRRSTLDNIRSIANYLGLEFYIGPPRMQEFQEATARFDHVENPDAHWVALDPRQVQTLDQPPDIDRLALPLGWFRKHRIPLNAATLILATDDAMTPAIPKGATAIIHTGETDLGKDASVYAVNISGVIKLRRVELGEDYIIARPDNPTTFTDTIPKRYAGTITILGRLRAVVSSLD